MDLFETLGDILQPNQNFCIEETTRVSVICPECGDIERVNIENSCLSALEIITEELFNAGPCADCQVAGYSSQNLNCFL